MQRPGQPPSSPQPGRNESSNCHTRSRSRHVQRHRAQQPPSARQVEANDAHARPAPADCGQRARKLRVDVAVLQPEPWLRHQLPRARLFAARPCARRLQQRCAVPVLHGDCAAHRARHRAEARRQGLARLGPAALLPLCRQLRRGAPLPRVPLAIRDHRRRARRHRRGMALDSSGRVLCRSRRAIRTRSAARDRGDHQLPLWGLCDPLPRLGTCAQARLLVRALPARRKECE